jgi:hypothetical protein
LGEDTVSDEPDEPQGWRTVLERQPEYLRAIGTMGIEVVNLEAMLAVCLSQILKLSEDIADAIYFAPQATGPRLAIFAAAANAALAEHQNYRDRANDLVERARRLASKRHDFLHQAWGFHTDQTRTSVSSRPLPFIENKPARLVPLTEITDAISRTRRLAGDVIDFTNKLNEDDSYRPSQGKQPEPLPNGK